MVLRIKLIVTVTSSLLAVVLPQGEAGNYSEEGFASYYSEEFNGRKTANGEIFDMTDYSAAHRTLPFNTYLKVTNLQNNYSLLVRINDRGPFIKNRIIDLSEAAARSLGSYKHGLTKVRAEEIELTPLTAEQDSLFMNNLVIDCLGNIDKLSNFSLSLWSSNYLIHALYIANDLYVKDDVENILICPRGKGDFKKYHIVISGIKSKAEADKLKSYYQQQGFMNIQYFR